MLSEQTLVQFMLLSYGGGLAPGDVVWGFHTLVQVTPESPDTYSELLQRSVTVPNEPCSHAMSLSPVLSDAMPFHLLLAGSGDPTERSTQSAAPAPPPPLEQDAFSGHANTDLPLILSHL